MTLQLRNRLYLWLFASTKDLNNDFTCLLMVLPRTLQYHLRLYLCLYTFHNELTYDFTPAHTTLPTTLCLHLRAHLWHNDFKYNPNNLIMSSLRNLSATLRFQIRLFTFAYNLTHDYMSWPTTLPTTLLYHLSDTDDYTSFQMTLRTTLHVHRLL